MASLKTETVQQNQRDQQRSKKHIIVKEHPTIPCAMYYEDIFSTIIVECRHPEHNQLSLLLLLNEKGEGNQPSPRETEPRNNQPTTLLQHHDTTQDAGAHPSVVSRGGLIIVHG